MAPNSKAKLKELSKRIRAARTKLEELDKAKGIVPQPGSLSLSYCLRLWVPPPAISSCARICGPTLTMNLKLRPQGKLEHERKRVFKAMQNDHETNRREQERQAGKPLVYGDIIQLRHKYSDQFLTGSTIKTSVLEYNNLRVSLQEHSDRSCFFRIMPKYKVRGTGDEVKAGDQIKLVSEKAAGHFLSHSASRFSKAAGAAKGEGLLNEGDFEVTLSAQERAWSVQVYSGQADGTAGCLRAGDVIQLQDREKDGFLSAAAMLAVDRQAAIAHAAAHARDGARYTGKLFSGETPAAVPTAYLNAGRDDDGGLRQESMSYWQLYLHEQHEVGVPLSYELQKVVFRHLVSGMYLAVDPQSTVAGSRTASNNSFTVLLVTDPRDPRAAFRISNVSDVTAHIMSSTYCRLQNIMTGAYLHTSNSELEALDVHTYEQCRAKDDIDDDIFDELLNVNFRSQFSFEDAFEISQVSDDLLDDFNIVYGSVPLLELVAEATSAEASRALPSQIQLFGAERANKALSQDAAWGNHGKRLISVGTQMLKMLGEFLLDEEEDEDATEWGASAYARQGLCQDLGVLDLIVKILSGPIDNLQESRLTPQMFKELGSDEESHELLWNQAFVTLKNSAEGEETATDRYIARHSKCFSLHSMYLKTHGSAELLIELYENNRDALDDLLEDVSRLDWVLNHLDLVEDASLSQDFIDHDFYNFLATLCVCDELAVQRAQNRIFDKMGPGLGDALYSNGHFVKLRIAGAVSTGQSVMQRASGVSVQRALSSVQSKAESTGVVVQQGGEPDVELSEMFDLVPGTGKEPEKTQDGQLSGMRTLEYYEPMPSAEAKFSFVTSNLRLCAAICEGHGRRQVDLVTESMPKEVLFTIIKTSAVPYELRRHSADVLHEVFLDTGGALTVLSATSGKRVFAFEEEEQAPATGPTVLDLDEYRQLNRDRELYAAELIDWMTARDGFGRELEQFALEMRRLVAEEDEFEDHHKEHGAFVIVMLRSLFFCVEAGHVRDWQTIENVVKTLLQHFLVFAEDLITDDAATSHDDETRDAVTAEALESVLETLQLLTVHEKEVSMHNFFSDYCALLRLVQRRGSSGTADAKGRLGEMSMVKPLFDTSPDTKPDWTVLYPPNERDPVVACLTRHFKESSLDVCIHLDRHIDDAYKHKAKVASKYPSLGLKTTPMNLDGILLDIVTRGEPEESEGTCKTAPLI